MRAAQGIFFTAGPRIHLGEVWFILPVKGKTGFSRFTNGQGQASVSGPNGKRPFFCLGAFTRSFFMYTSVAVKEM